MADSLTLPGGIPVVWTSARAVGQSSFVVTLPFGLCNSRTGSASTLGTPAAAKEGPMPRSTTCFVPFLMMNPPIRTSSPVCTRPRVEILSKRAVAAGVAAATTLTPELFPFSTAAVLFCPTSLPNPPRSIGLEPVVFTAIGFEASGKPWWAERKRISIAGTETSSFTPLVIREIRMTWNEDFTAGTQMLKSNKTIRIPNDRRRRGCLNCSSLLKTA